MTRKRDRFFAGFGAILFLITGSALTIGVIWNAIASRHTDSKASSSQTATNDTNAASKETTKLEGTKLTDFTPVASIPTLNVSDTVPGTGAEVKAGDTVT